jgi:hypothetical protein
MTLKYEKRTEDGAVTMMCLAYPKPSAIAKKQKMALMPRLQWEYEVSILQPCGRGDSDSYLSYKEVRQRKLEFNEISGIEATNGWLAISKDVPECAHKGEGNDSFTAWG